MTLSRVVAFNTIAQTVGKGISLAAGVILTSILTRKLGVINYGAYVYVFTVVLFANAIADWGSTFIATREASRAGKQQEKVFGNALVLKVLSAASVTAALIVLSQVLEVFHSYREVMLIAGFLIPFLSLKTFFQIVFQTRLELWKLSVMDTASSVFFLLTILLLPEEMINLRLVFTFLIGAAFVAVIGGKAMMDKKVKLSLKPDKKILKVLVRESAVMGLLLTVFSMYNRLDILLLERLQGQAAVGIYGLSYKIYENLVVGAAFFANSVFPILSSRTKKKALFRRTFQKVIGSLLILGLILSLLTVVLAGPVIYLISGPDYARAIAPLQILGLSLIVAYLNHATGYSLVALNHQLVSMKIAGVALVLNLGLNWLFIPQYSYLASAAITLLTELFVFALSFWSLTRVMGKLNPKQLLSDLAPKLLLKKLTS